MIRNVRNLFITLGISFLGGWLFQQSHAPAPYLLGSLIVTWSLNYFIKLKFYQPTIPRWFQISVLVCMSVLIGGAFSPSVIDFASQWAITVIAMIVVTIIATFAGYLYLNKIRKYDHNLAILCSLPGGQAEIVAISSTLVEKDYVVVFCHLVILYYSYVFCG